MKHVIVLIEDNEDDIELTRRALAENNVGNELIILRDGSEALDWFFQKGAYQQRSRDLVPSVVLLDLKMPLIDGHEVLQRLRADEAWRRTPVVILTSSLEQGDLERSYGEGANSYIVKPVDFTSFVDAMRTLGVYWLLLNRPPSIPPALAGQPLREARPA